MRAAVIGSGLGGLAAASVLAARGHGVVLFERNDWLGGKAALLEENGFRFDMGPTILTLPRVLERIFAEAGIKKHVFKNIVVRFKIVTVDLTIEDRHFFVH